MLTVDTVRQCAGRDRVASRREERAMMRIALGTLLLLVAAAPAFA